METSTISFVICCRLSSYEFGNYKLKLNGAICLQPLDEIQIKEYLKNIENKDYNNFIDYINNNKIIKEISQNPLFLNLCIDAYRTHTNKPITTKITIRNIYNFINKNLSFGLKT